MIPLIIGPQVPIGSTWFDTTQVEKGKLHGASFPATPPTDENALNSYTLAHYYDLGLTQYIAFHRTNDPAFLTNARKVCDSWWKHPKWIGEGNIKLWPDSATPPPRHAGIGGLILRALDGRPEMWEWIIGYTLFHFDLWLNRRITNPELYYGVREGAFALHYAVWLAASLPDSYPNAAQIKTHLLFDIENVCLNYFGRLQQADGSWRWNDVDVTDADGGTLQGITQPFQVGLLLCALCDAHHLPLSLSAKTSIKTQILTGCRHLYSDGPYRKDEPIPYDPGKRRRSFWYLYHGGTSVNPTKFAQGGWSYPGTNITEIKDERQAIGTVVAAYAYAYRISGDAFYKQAGDELWDSAYGDTDGIRNFFDTDGKGYNQNARRAGSYRAWLLTEMPPSPTPTEPDSLSVKYPTTEAAQTRQWQEMRVRGYSPFKHLSGPNVEYKKWGK